MLPLSPTPVIVGPINTSSETSWRYEGQTNALFHSCTNPSASREKSKKDSPVFSDNTYLSRRQSKYEDTDNICLSDNHAYTKTDNTHLLDNQMMYDYNL